MKKITILLILSIISSTTLQLFANATAVNMENDSIIKKEPIKLKEVEVNAQYPQRVNALKFDVPVAYLPIRINMVSSDVLKKFNIQDFQQAVRYLPGAQVKTSHGAFQQITIRGYLHSVISLDGIRDERSSMDNSFVIMDLSSIEKMEIIKGPGSVFFGQSVVGGLINMTRKRPTAEKQIESRVAYGSYNKMQTTFGFGEKLFGPINYYAQVNYQNEDGWRENAVIRRSGYLAIGGDLSPNDRLDIRMGVSKDGYSIEAGLPRLMSADIYNVVDDSKYLNELDLLPGLSRKARYNNDSEYLRYRNFNVMGTYKHSFSKGLRFSETISYSDDGIDCFRNNGFSYLTSNSPIYNHYYKIKGKDGGETIKYISLDSLSYNTPIHFYHQAKTINNQLEVSGAFYTGRIKHNYQGGYSFVAFIRESYNGSLAEDFSGPGLIGHINVWEPHSMGYIESKFDKVGVRREFSHAINVQDLVEISDKFKFMMSFRQDWFNRKAATFPVINGKYEYEKNIPYARSKTNAFTYKAGLVYFPAKIISVYGSYGSYYKPVRDAYDETKIYINPNGHEYMPSEGGELFKPQKGYQGELGFELALTNKFRVGGSLFYISKENILRTLASKGDIINGETLEKTVVGQVGRMDSKGFDLDLTYTPLPNLTIASGYSITKAKIKKMAKNDYLTIDPTQENYLPVRTFYTYISYLFSEGVLKGWEVNLSETFQDKMLQVISNKFYYPDYWLTDASIAYTLKNNIRIGFNLNNLFNKHYYTQSLESASYQMAPGIPRNLMFSMSYKL